MQVSLPMYLNDRNAVEDLWRLLRRELICLGISNAPTELSWPTDYHSHWLQPDILLSQACGFPFIDDLDGHVQLVGCLRYAVQGARGIHCRSQIVVRADDPRKTLEEYRDARFAYNASNSQSGYNSIRALVAPLAKNGRFFSSSLETGAHALSLAAIDQCEADLAAIDCVTLALLRRIDAPSVMGLRTLCESDEYPGLPLITAGGSSPEMVYALQSAWRKFFEQSDTKSVRDALRLDGFEVQDPTIYDRCRQMRDSAASLGCFRL
jgi:ABC-type phosphate/phosphonate transport system substrate-binding protein